MDTSLRPAGRFTPDIRESGWGTCHWVSILAFIATGLALGLGIQRHFWAALEAGVSIRDVAALAHSLSEVQNLATLFLIKRFDLLGLMVLYAPGYRLGAWFYPVINGALLLLSAVLCRSLARGLAVDGRGMLAAGALIGIVGNPYLLLTMAGPNKELPLLALTLAYGLVLVRKPRSWLAIAGGLACLAGLFRDGYGAILLVFLAVHALGYGRKWGTVRLCVLVLALCLVATVLIEYATQIVPVLRRNADAATRIRGLADPGVLFAGSALDQVLQWGKRCVLNATSLAIFPVPVQSTGRPYWIGILYWVFGVLNLLACCGVLSAALSKTERSRLLETAITLWIGTWLLMSLSLYVQPRYMMATLPFGLLVFSSLERRTRIVISLLVASIVAGVVGVKWLQQPGFARVTPDTFWADPYR